MTPGRWVWLAWCGLWTLIWALIGIFTLGLGWILALGSMAAMLLVLIPKSSNRSIQQSGPYAIRPPDPRCRYCGQPRTRHGGPNQTVCPLPPNGLDVWRRGLQIVRRLQPTGAEQEPGPVVVVLGRGLVCADRDAW